MMKKITPLFVALMITFMVTPTIIAQQIDNGILTNIALTPIDFDASGQVQSTDLTPVISQLGGAGYNNADMDMNGQVQTIDINSLLIPNLGKGSQL